MKNEILTPCYQLVAAAVNGTYQGILIAVLVAAGLRMFGRTNAATRYAVWFGTLLLLALIIPAHCLRGTWDRSVTPAAVETSVPVLALKPDLDVIRTEASSLTRDSEGKPEDFAADAQYAANNRELDADDANAPQNAEFGTGAATEIESPEDPVRAIVLALPEAAHPNQAEQNRIPAWGFLAGTRQMLSWLRERIVTPVSPWKVAPRTPLYIAALLPLTWLAIAGAKISFLIWQLFRIRRLKLNSVEAKPEFNALFLSLRERVGVRRNVSLRVSTECKSPVVLGFLKPVILLPADAGLEASEHVLRHELAHVCRRDDWANLVQQSIKALLFFHPAIRWVSKRISLEREIACDDQVLQSSLRPRAYALLLADLAGRMQPSVLAPGVSTNQSQLKQRIDMILNSNRNTSPGLAKVRLGLLATATAVLAAAAIYLAPRLAVAQSAPAAPPAPALPPGTPDTPSVSLAPPAPVAVPGDEAPSLPPAPPTVILTTPSIPTGPKFKPGSTVSVDVRPTVAPQPSIVVLTAPSAALAPVTPVAAVPPMPAAPLVASADLPSDPTQPAAPRPARRPGRDASLEERLDRLEKMVESLVAQQKNKPNQFEFSPKPQPGELKSNWKISPDSANQWEQKQADMAKKQAEFELKRADMSRQLAELEGQNRLNDPKVAAKIKEIAEQDAKLAGAAEQAAREAQRAARDAQRGRTIHRMRDGSQQELDALRKQHETLEKQMEKLDRQIEKLERQQEQLEEQEQNDEQGAAVEQDQNASNNDHPAECSNNGNVASRQPATR